MSLLTMISGPNRGVAGLCNLPSPTSIIGSTDVNVPLLLRLANQEGKELSRRHDWQAMVVDYTVTTLGAEQQTDFPSDYDRMVPYPEVWNRDLAQPYNGPTSYRTWGTLKGLSVVSASPGWWRILGDVLHIYPAPTAGQTIAFPYVSTNWCRTEGGTGQTFWQADTDIGIIPENVMTLGIVWRYKKSKGLEYAEDMSTYEREVERACSRDRGAGVLRPTRSMPGAPWPAWTGTVTP